MGCINFSDPKPAFERPQSSHSSLVDPRFEHESCGVGFVATLTNEPSRDILDKALTALARLEHRGAIAADGKSGDGIGIATGIPRDFLLKSVGVSLAADRPLAVGVVFCPQDAAGSGCAAQAEFEQALAAQQLTALASPFPLFHQRYATNVAPSWDRAQPLRMLAHNGEINTVWGNRARMDARAATFADELKPVFTPDGSDSTSLDETVEMLARNGRTVAEALRMLIPPATMEKPSAFFAYAADSAEPWDGPAAIAFADGYLVGAVLDRNGLRPCRYFVTEDNLVVLGSEAGLVDLDPETIVHSGRLGPGQMLVADLDEHKLYEDEQIQAIFDGAAPEYERLLEDHTLEDHVPDPPLDAAEMTRLQLGFGYSREDVNMILKPMAVD